MSTKITTHTREDEAKFMITYFKNRLAEEGNSKACEGYLKTKLEQAENELAYILGVNSLASQHIVSDNYRTALKEMGIID